MKETMDELGGNPEQKSHISQIYREASYPTWRLSHQTGEAKGTGLPGGEEWTQPSSSWLYQCGVRKAVGSPQSPQKGI